MQSDLHQLKAARTLLGWSQKTLARQAGLSLPALANLERGAVKSRPQTLQRLRHALEQAGVEFIEGPGVRLRGEPFEFHKYSGKYFIDDITRDIEENLFPPDEVCGIGIDELNFRKYSSDQDRAYIEHIVKHKIRQRFISPHSQKIMYNTQYYRFLPRDVIGNIFWFTYADRLILINWRKPAQALWIRNPSIAETYKRQFEIMWKMATPHNRAVVPGSGD